MADQPSLRPDDATTFLSNGQANRLPVPGTVARGHLKTNRELFFGQRPSQATDWARPTLLMGASGFNLIPVAAFVVTSDNASQSFPFPITREVLEHGRNRYSIYCAVCHDPMGTGHGPIVQRGYTPPPSYHIARLRAAPPGHFFDVITNGYGSMPDYKQQVPTRDRWAIAAYIRALQLSRHYPEADLTTEMRNEWQAQDAKSKTHD
jgi:mono/diheme cytochrome c family protein